MAKAGCVVSRTELVSELKKNLNVLLDARLLISPSTICVTRTSCKKNTFQQKNMQLITKFLAPRFCLTCNKKIKLSK